MKSILKSKRGYSLIEVLLAITIFSVAFAMITNFYLSFLKFNNHIESKNLVYTNILNAISSIKYRVDGAKELEILTMQEFEKLEDLAPEYKYIYVKAGNIISGEMDSTNSFEILNKSQIKNHNLNLIFQNKNNSLNIKILITDENGINIIEPLNCLILLYNMKNNNNFIKGTEGTVIIYKPDEK